MNAGRSGSLRTAADRLDAFTARVGRLVAYLGFATVLICFATVYLRYVLGVGFIWLQESYVWTHCAAIMFGSSYGAPARAASCGSTSFYNRFGARGKALVDLFGTLVFLLPFLVMMSGSGWSFFLSSWKMTERSAYESGLPAIYLLKGTILVFALLMAMQALAIVLRCVVTLLGDPQPERPAMPPEQDLSSHGPDPDR